MGLIIVIVVIVIIIIALIIALLSSSDSESEKATTGTDEDEKDKKKAKEAEWKELNENYKFVIHGASIKCLYCSMPFGILNVTANTVKLQDKNQATTGDNKRENFVFTGLCMHPSQQKAIAPPPPCLSIVNPGNWKSFSDTKINNDNALLKKSTIPCLISGQDITIFHSGQKSEPPLRLPYIVKPKIKIKAKQIDYTLVLDKNGEAFAGYPVLEFEITDGEPGYYIDIQVVRKNKSLLTNNRGIVDSWEKSLPLEDRMKKEAFSSWSAGYTTLQLDGSGKQTFEMPLEWWQDIARTPLADFTIMPICFKVSAFQNMDDIVPLVETDSSDKMTVNVHNNLEEFKVVDHGYINGGINKSVSMKFIVKEAGTTEMYTIVQWVKSENPIWDATKNKTYATVNVYNLTQYINNPNIWRLDRLKMNPRYGDGVYSISVDGRTAIATDSPGGTIPSGYTHDFFSSDFETRVHLNFEVPSNLTITVREGSPPIYSKLIGVIAPPEPLILANAFWKCRILQVRNASTGHVRITHPENFTGP